MSGSNEQRVVNTTTGGMKGAKDEAYSLLPWDMMGEVARLYNFGAQKYDRNNWRKGYDWHLSHDALHRHLAAFWNGERKDEESQCDHLASVIFHAFALMYFQDAHPDLDDRPCTAMPRQRAIEDMRARLEAGQITLTDDEPRVIDAVKLHTISLDERPGPFIGEFVVTDVTPEGAKHRVEHVSVDPALEGSQYRIASQSDSPLENPVQATTTPDVLRAPSSGAGEPVSMQVPVYATDKADGMLHTALVTVPVSMTFEEYRALREGENLPAHARVVRADTIVP